MTSVDRPRRLLIVANPYPPMVSAGTNRIVRFIRHLPDEGWLPSVLTATAKGSAPVPAEIYTCRAPALLPQRVLGGGPRSMRVHRWVSFPDIYASWLPAAFVTGLGMTHRMTFDAIFSSAPRPSAHLVAALLAKATGLPWLADYRDPWLNNEFRDDPTPLHRCAHAFLEASVLSGAAAVTTVTDNMLSDIEMRCPFVKGRGSVIANGFDRAEAAKPAELGPGFWIVYTGRLYGRETQVDAFLAAMSALPADVKALFVGGGEARVLLAAERHGIVDRVRVLPHVDHDVALGLQQAADALLLVTGDAAMMASSKVYEYLDSCRPVFAICPRAGAAHDVFAEFGGGVCVAPDDDLGPALVGFVDAVRAGDLSECDHRRLDRFEFSNLTRQLAMVLDRIAGDAEAARR